VGLLGLVAYERWMARRAAAGLGPGSDAGSRVQFGPGSMQIGELPARRLRGIASWPAARRLALMIAVGIGLHNFAESLAIGQSAVRSQIVLATLLVIGFGLHNATEGFGIVAPLAGDLDDDGRPARPRPAPATFWPTAWSWGCWPASAPTPSSPPPRPDNRSEP
jgi:ZIP family zinc transporter